MARSQRRGFAWLVPRASFVGAGAMIGIAVGLFVRVDSRRPEPVTATPFVLGAPVPAPLPPPPVVTA